MKALVAIVSYLAAMPIPAAELNQLLLAPDLIIVNASIHTMDEARPTAGAVAILGNRIAALGSTPEIHRLAGPKTPVLDARQKVVLPGLHDAHVHFLTA